MERPDFPLVFDATMIRTFRSCPRRFYYEFLLGLCEKVKSTDLIAGGAFARGIEVARKAFYEFGATQDEALAAGLEALIAEYGDHEPAEKNPKTLDRMCGALEYYMAVWPFHTDSLQPFMFGDKPAVEFTFAYPLPYSTHPVSGEPLFYAGRSDLFGEIGGVKAINDDKTTKSLGDRWANQWKLRSQFTGYIWAAQQQGHDIETVLIRGLAILKTQYNHAQAIVYRPKFLVDRWMHQLTRDIERMKQLWSEGYWDYDLDESCSMYGGCPFVPVCSSSDEEQWLGSYQRRIWSPLDKNPSKPVDEPV